jgi:hypothetical protein
LVSSEPHLLQIYSSELPILQDLTLAEPPPL